MNENYPCTAWWGVNNDWADEMSSYPNLKYMFVSPKIEDRKWAYDNWNENCLKELELKAIERREA